MSDITALGELLIDFTPRGLSERGNFLFELNPGGAPANVLAAATALGAKCSFIGKVGNDTFGDFLEKSLSSRGICTSALSRTDSAFTTLAFVTLGEDGNRTFDFSRKGSADTLLSPDEVDYKMICESEIFHCGTISLTDEPSASAQLAALDCAKEAGVLISVDPNLRLNLWKSRGDAEWAIRRTLSFADIVKISDYELEFLYGTTDVKEGIGRFLAEYSPKILFATCGENGAFASDGKEIYFHPCYSVSVVDTTGAGDSFCGAALALICKRGIADSAARLPEILAYASAAAAITTTRYGAISVMPCDAEISELIKSQN